MTVDDIVKIAQHLNISISIAVGVVVLIVCILNIDKLLLLLSKVQGLFSFCSNKARKGTVANSIRGKMMKSSKPFRSIKSGVITPDLKIDWIKDETPEAFIKNNKVIIRIKQHSNPHENFVTAVSMFVKQGLLPKAKRYIDSDILTMSQLSVSRFLIVNGDSNAIEYFEDNYLNPIIQNNEESAETYNELKAIDKNGMFINILLNEYAKAASRLYPEEPDPLFAVESREFLSFLYRIAMRVESDENELDFNREYFKVSVLLAARTDKYRKRGLEPYTKHIQKIISEGIETIYVFGLGWKVDLAKKLSQHVADIDFRVDSVIPHNYRHKSILDGHTISGVCCEINVYKENG